jgi:Glycosyltransferase family 92
MNRCDNAENKLKIIDVKPIDGVKKEFGVCVKQLTYPNRDFVVRFIEWVHMMKILGADKIFFYNRFVHHELMKVVEYFESRGLVDMKPFLEPSGISNVILRKVESFVLEASMVNDCFYRTKNLYQHIAILDPDEVILPHNESVYTWRDLLKSAKPFFDVYNQRMVTYPKTDQKLVEGIPEYNYLLQHVQVSQLALFLKSKFYFIYFQHCSA